MAAPENDSSLPKHERKETTYEKWAKDYCFDLADMAEARVAIPASRIPVMGILNGKKIQVGEGTIHPETLIFMTKLLDTEESKIFVAALREKAGKEKSTAGYIEVSEVTFKTGVETGKFGEVITQGVELPSGECPLTCLNRPAKNCVIHRPKAD